MICASRQENPEERIFIYKQILRVAPDYLETYKQLIPLIKDPKEKQELLLQAASKAQLAGDVAFEAFCREQVEIAKFTSVITKEAWAAAASLALPPYPQELQEFLDGDCTIWRGKKRSETHIVVPLFSQVDIDGLPVPLTLETLNLLDKNSGGPGYRYIDFWNQPPNNTATDVEFHYAVMTTDIHLEHSFLSYDDHIRVLPDGYEAPSVLDAARAILWANRRSEKCYPEIDSQTYTYCKESSRDRHFLVGCFSHVSGLCIGLNSGGARVGVAGWRKF